MFCQNESRRGESHLDKEILILAAALMIGLLSGCSKPKQDPMTPAIEPAKAAESAAAPQQSPVFFPMKAGQKPKTIILTYHDMVPKRDSSSLWFDCTPKELTEQIEGLEKKGARFLSMEELRNGLTGQQPLPDRGVLICFADNYQGFYTHAWPYLRGKKIPVTLFVHTGHVGSQKGRPKMTWQTLNELQSSGLVSVQSQTVSHPEDLSSLSEAQQVKELSDSKRAIEENLKSSCYAIAYPNGRFSPEVGWKAKEAGYVIGFTEQQKPAETASDILLVPRWVHTKWREAWHSVNGSES